MKTIRKNQFSFEGKSYETRAILEGKFCRIQVFLQEEEVMPYSFLINRESEFVDLEKILESGDIYTEMMDMAEKDVKRNVVDGEWRKSI